jgi:hypothetical protein
MSILTYERAEETDWKSSELRNEEIHDLFFQEILLG